mgnify:CR=1 FL=1
MKSHVESKDVMTSRISILAVAHFHRTMQSMFGVKEDLPCVKVEFGYVSPATALGRKRVKIKKSTIDITWTPSLRAQAEAMAP